MATSTTDITEEMKKMMSIFSINKSNCFNEISMHLTKLDIRLVDIERQCCPNAHEAIARELKEDTKRVMEDTAVCSSSASRRRPPLPHLPSLWML